MVNACLSSTPDVRRCLFLAFPDFGGEYRTEMLGHDLPEPAQPMFNRNRLQDFVMDFGQPGPPGAAEF